MGIMREYQPTNPRSIVPSLDFSAGYMNYVLNRTVRIISPKATPRSNPNRQQLRLLDEMEKNVEDRVEDAAIFAIRRKLMTDRSYYFDAYKKGPRW
jgi:hypothetical protein